MKKKIEKYKVNPWYNTKTREFQYGIDVVMQDGETYHCSDSKNPIFYSTRPEASKEVRRLNAKLKTEA